ncbi:FeoA family protein [Sandaracinobacteroides saxicola]|uniref:Ferrous iron transport protein A n=1 Tax=Sandaracinobacteroides saxicola TaxID=2759707 RepID=A0A7G5IJU8_9SPHN|nr:FeoA family protein [Sandaracinobacteroides saxicola]QMW23640.1 ferrous iron transport protein A [Sandaracinobacteroides saxicola]
MTPLDLLSPGQTMRIAALASHDPAATLRLHEMGFDEGVTVSLLHRGPFGQDPIAVQVGTMTVGLRRALAALVLTVPA